MTPPKSPEEILADYTEDLLAERPPRLAADVAQLDENNRREVMRLAALVRAVKAAKAETPNPSPEFLAHLDAQVIAEIDQWSVKERADLTRLAAAPAPRQPARYASRPWRDILLGFFLPWRWQLLGCAVAVILLLQGHLFLRVKSLQEENQGLRHRLGRLSASERLIPLSLPTEIGLRLHIERRIQELEKERASKTGAERRSLERAVQELQALLQAGGIK